jgi:hypothetical protein
LQRSNIPNLQMIELKGISLSKKNYELVTQILTSKYIEYELDKPYNIATENAATY